MNDLPCSILVIDDNPDNFDVIVTLLDQQNYQLHYANSGREAIARLDILCPDLILLDVMMPDMDGIEVCQRIKALPRWSTVPIIIVTALSSKQDLALCLEAGADDFISKPINRLELKARVQSMLRIRLQYQQLQTFNARLEAEVHNRTMELQKMIFQDALTTLPSRAALLAEMKTQSNLEAAACALIYLDCDYFKLVNGSFGHTVGNQLLQAIAVRLQQHLRPGDILARMGEDEYCFLLTQMADMTAVEQFVKDVLQAFQQPFSVTSCEIFITVCAGITLGNCLERSPEQLLQDADTAMYQAKLRGRGNYQFFDRQMQRKIADRLTLENDLQRALDQQEFVTYYQPIMDLQNHRLVGFEALVRWHHAPDREPVSPGIFIPCMETTGLIVPLGVLVLRQACQQLHVWHQQGWTALTMSVNLSVRQFACPTLIADIDRVLAETGVNPACLKLEITESAIMENAETAISITEELRLRQIQISIDDFGTGYSSLGYLHRFPLDNLKIDRSFVDQIRSESREYYVVDTIIALSKQLGLSVIAEGIETPEQLDWLRKLGCEFGQGYIFSQPLPAAAIAQQFLIS